MDLSKRVVYDAEFPVVIVPKSGDNDGVVFYVKSLQAKSIQKIERDGRNKVLVSKQKQGTYGTMEVDDLSSFEDTERSKIIASIVRWEWNGNEFGDLGKDPAFTTENISAVVDHENSQWIVDLLYAGAGNIGNFTPK